MIKFKKLAIASAVIALSSSAALAATQDSPFYAKGTFVLSKGWRLSQADTSSLGLTARPSEWGTTTFGGGVGLGYHLMDNVRGDVSLFYLNGGPTYENLTMDNAKVQVPTGVEAVVSRKLTKMDSTGVVGFVNGFVDVADMGMAKLYIGGGLGGAYLETTTTINGQNKIKDPDDDSQDKDVDMTANTTYPSRLAFAFNISGGMSFEASPGMLLDVGYSYMNLGKPGTPNGSATAWPHESRATHNLNVGFRINM